MLQERDAREVHRDVPAGEAVVQSHEEALATDHSHKEVFDSLGFSQELAGEPPVREELDAKEIHET